MRAGDGRAAVSRRGEEGHCWPSPKGGGHAAGQRGHCSQASHSPGPVKGCLPASREWHMQGQQGEAGHVDRKLTQA